MTYQSVWWRSPIEYGAGARQAQTWPAAMEQYQRPHNPRHYDLPLEPRTSPLYFEHQRMGMPRYRGLFRDKPACVTAHYPTGADSKPRGFHGRVYYEQIGPDQLRSGGPQKDDLYWLEHPPYNPTFPKRLPTENQLTDDAGSGLNLPQLPKDSSLAITESLRASTVSPGHSARKHRTYKTAEYGNRAMAAPP